MKRPAEPTNANTDVETTTAMTEAEPTYANTAAVDGESTPTVRITQTEPTYANASATEAEPNYAALELTQPSTMVPPFATEVQYSEVQQCSEEGES